MGVKETEVARACVWEEKGRWAVGEELPLKGDVPLQRLLPLYPKAFVLDAGQPKNTAQHTQ